MRIIFFALTFLMSSLALAQGREEIETRKPWLPNTTIDVTSYDLDLTVPALDADILPAVVTIKLKPRMELSSLRLNIDARRIAVKAVTLNGSETTFEYLKGIAGTPKGNINGDVLKVSSPGPLPEGSPVTLTIAYDVTVNKSGDHGMEGLFYKANYFGSDILSTRSWPYYARDWIPSNDHPSDIATFSTTLHFPEGLRGLANGQLVLNFPGHDETGLRLVRWEQSVPTAPHTFTVVVGKFEETHTKICFNMSSPNDDLIPCELATESVSADLYLPLEIPKKPEFQASFELSSRSLVWLSSLLGKYSFDKLGIVSGPHPFSMEHASLITLTRARSAVHEVTHHWWGNGVQIGSWGDLWLSEGFTTYFTGLFNEYKTGKDDSCRQETDVLRAPDDIDPMDLYGNTPYCKGASALHGLRETIAFLLRKDLTDPVVKDALFLTFRKIYQTYRGRILSTDALLLHLKEELPKTLQKADPEISIFDVEKSLESWEEKWLGRQSL